MPNFEKMASAPLKTLCKPQARNPGPLTKEELNTLKTLKRELVSPPVLTLPKRKGQYTLDTDPCDRHVGCVLLQKYEQGTMKPFGNWSGTLPNEEKNTDTTHRECCTIVWVVLLSRPYLELRRFIIITDLHE